MNRYRVLPVVLDVLDDGFRLYRRNLAGFTLVATVVLVALAVLAMSFMAFVRTEIGTSAGWTFLAAVILLLVGYPLVLYAFAALSRAAAAAIEGRPITVPSALRLNPLRGCGMVLFNVLFIVMVSFAAATLSMLSGCALLYTVTIGAGLSSVGDSDSSAAVAAFVLVLTQVGTLWSITTVGAWLASVVYALQAFVLEQRSWSTAAQRSFGLMFGRFEYSLVMFIGAGAIFGTLVLSYTGSLLVLSTMIQNVLELDWPPLVRDIITIVLTVASLVVLLPPLAIWMAMFYQRLVRDRDGTEISQRVADWLAQPGGHSV